MRNGNLFNLFAKNFFNDFYRLFIPGLRGMVSFVVGYETLRIAIVFWSVLQYGFSNRIAVSMRSVWALHRRNHHGALVPWVTVCISESKKCFELKNRQVAGAIRRVEDSLLL